MIKHFSITVFGKVQGVFFRASTQEKAQALNLNGFVCNEKNGTVYIEVEGEENSLVDFITWCKHGPRLASVEQCISKEEPVKGFLDFIIK